MEERVSKSYTRGKKALFSGWGVVLGPPVCSSLSRSILESKRPPSF